MIQSKRFLSLIILISLVPAINGCALFVKAPAVPGLELRSAENILSYIWTDDLNFEGLEQAASESIRYYEALPLTKAFHYGSLIYSPQEMAATLRLFLTLTGSYHGKELKKQLGEKFLFFESKNSEGEAFFTGYYEPVLEGSPVPEGEFTAPLYKTPDDLISADLGQFSENWINETIVGKLEGKRLVPYDSRDEIVYDNSLQERVQPIAYVNEIELFFLQIQGSGLITLTDGSQKRVNYAQKNGHPYYAIGKVLKDKIPADKMSLQSIKEYLYAHPEEVRKILSHNQSYTFFREIEEGPLGNIEVPLTPDRSIAMDRRIVPGGGLAYIETEIPLFDNDRIIAWKPVRRFVLVQDTGGAIRDHGRVDIFFGRGKTAELTAGHMKQNGRAFLIVARKEFLL